MGNLSRIPRPLAALLAVVAVVGTTFALIVPPWQNPDEPQHFSYTHTLVNEGRLPGGEGAKFSNEMFSSLIATNFDATLVLPISHPEWSELKAERFLASPKAHDPEGGGGYHEAASYPPAYYVFQIPPQLVLNGESVLTRLYASRVWSVLWLLINTTAAWLLVGEAFGRRRSLQLAGAATIGLWPMVAYMGSSVSPDSMQFALWTTAFWLGLRLARQGLQLGPALALGATVGVAMITKATSLALVPPTVLLLVWLAWRARAEGGRAALAAGVAIAALALPPAAWTAYTRSTDRAAFAQVGAATPGEEFDVRWFGSYLWQFYLPRLSSMTPFEHHFPVISARPAVNNWLAGGSAVFGWVNVWFARPVYHVVGGALAVAALLCLIGLGQRRRSVRERGADGGRAAAVAFIGLASLLLVGGTHYTDFRFFHSGYGPFAQGRYILPAVSPLLALMIAGALSWLPRRWPGLGAGAWVGGLLVFDAAAFGLMLDRWYA